MSDYLPALIGGVLIGLSASILLLLNGRVAGISGIVGNLARGRKITTNAAFVAGLIVAPVLYRLVAGHWPISTVNASWPLIIIGGLLVGFGSRMGSGCTSGHGIIGMARLSPRSIAAVATFLVAGIITATLLGAISR